MNCAKKAPNPAERYSFRMLLDSRKILSWQEWKSDSLILTIYQLP
jgi:hypothetical protein